MKTSTRFGAVVLLMFAGAFPATAQTNSHLPAVQKVGAVEYLTGGIGLDESTAIKRAQHSWPLALMFANAENGHATYAADVATTIRKRSGQIVFQARSAGPFLLVRLEAGKYFVEANNAGVSATRTFEVRDSISTNVNIIWPEMPGGVYSERR